LLLQSKFALVGQTSIYQTLPGGMGFFLRITRAMNVPEVLEGF
jgi:hypothetical protein